MLPRRKRIGKKKFPAVFSRGKMFHTPLLTARVAFDKGEAPTTFAFVVSRAVARTAVQRNLLRRRGYAAVRKHARDIRPGFSCAFFFKKNTGNAPFKDIERDVSALLRSARVLS